MSEGYKLTGIALELQTVLLLQRLAEYGVRAKLQLSLGVSCLYFRGEYHGFRCDECGFEEREEVSEVPESEGLALDFENAMVERIKGEGWTWSKETDKHLCPKCSES